MSHFNTLVQSSTQQACRLSVCHSILDLALIFRYTAFVYKKDVFLFLLPMFTKGTEKRGNYIMNLPKIAGTCNTNNSQKYVVCVKILIFHVIFCNIPMCVTNVGIKHFNVIVQLLCKTKCTKLTWCFINLHYMEGTRTFFHIGAEK